MDLSRELKIGEVDLILEFTDEEKHKIFTAVYKQGRLSNGVNPHDNPKVIMHYTIDYILKCVIQEFGEKDTIAVRLECLREEEWRKQSRRLLGLPPIQKSI